MNQPLGFQVYWVALKAPVIRFFKALFSLFFSFLSDVTPSFAVQHLLLATPHKTWTVSLHRLSNAEQREAGLTEAPCARRWRRLLHVTIHH